MDYSGLTLNIKQGEKIIEQTIAVKENE